MGIEAVSPIAKEYVEKDGAEMLFFVAKNESGVSSQVRSMCGLESASKSSKQDVSPTKKPKLVHTVSSDTPTLVLMDIPDDGGYYIGRMSKELDGSGVKQMIQDWKDKKLERKQLG